MYSLIKTEFAIQRGQLYLLYNKGDCRGEQVWESLFFTLICLTFKVCGDKAVTKMSDCYFHSIRAGVPTTAHRPNLAHGPVFIKNFIGTQPHPFIYLPSMAAFTLQGWNLVMTQTVWPAKPKT